MRQWIKPDELQSSLVMGTIRQIDLQPMGKASLIIEDSDQDLHKVLTHPKLIQANFSDLQGAKVICGTREARLADGQGPSFYSVMEIIHFLEGPQAGKTLTYQASG